MANYQFSLTQVMQATNAILKKLTSASVFGGVTTDTRKIEEGMLFIALKGENFDGHDFIADAAKKGAIGAIVNKDYDISLIEDIDIDILAVDDTLKAYQDLAHFWRKKFNIPVIAITGSNGKTTTKDLTAAVLSGKYNVLKTQANFNNEIGLPMTLLQLDGSYDVAVVEMGMRGLGQIKELTDIAKPTMGVITNVGETHMELLGSMENIAKAKGEMAQAIEINGNVILNADDEFVSKMNRLTKAHAIYFGINHAGDIKAFDIKTVNDGKTEFDAIVGDKVAHFTLNMIGIHNVYNCLAALAVGYACGLTVEEMQKGLATFKPTAMRFEYKRLADFNLINDAYNASPMSTKAALENLTKVAKKRKILVMGDMFELGSVEQKAHEDIGLLAALAVGYACGLTVEEMQKGLATFKPTAMRFEYKRLADFNLINDAYNASPMSTKAALENLTKVAKKRKILVMGDMFELGSVEQKAHEDIGLLAGKLGVDIVITRGTLTKFTAEAAKKAGVAKVFECVSHEEAVDVLKKELQKEDTVLFKGSHGMHMEKIIELLEKEYK